MNNTHHENPPSSPLTLVFGASGYIGTHLVPRLLAEGRSLRAVARRRAALETRGWQGVEIVEADALKPETLSKALAGQPSHCAIEVIARAGVSLGLDRINTR
ncbi:MAG TPA: NAD(P)H-binding protein [Azonexus sp.]|nr:NAD(P)H-binding protein [Azonexus sp.]